MKPISQDQMGRKLIVAFSLFLFELLPVGAQEELVPIKPSNEKPTLANPLAAWGSDYTNWVEVSVGNFWVDGSQAAFQQRYQLPAGVFGGIESLHLEQPISTNRTFTLDGRGIFGNHDYDLKLELRQDGLGYVRGGFTQFRTYYDRHGGFYPPDDVWLTPFDQDVAIDRGDAWVELGLRLPDFPQITFRYDHQFRSGTKDSTEWGDVTINPTTTRAIVPSFYSMDETRDIFRLDVKHTISETEVAGGVRYERINQDDGKFLLRQPGASTQAYVTQRDEADIDLFNAHASTATPINEQFLLTAAYAFTYIDTDASGSRIYGSSFDSIYDPFFRGRAQHYEGFLGLDGSTFFRQHEANVNLLYTPWETVAILPSLRVSKIDKSADANYTLTDFDSAGVATFTPSYGNNERDYLDVAQALEARYTGVTNWAFYARGEWTEDDADLYQLELPLDNPTDQDLLDENANRFTQKYTVGLNWYPLYRLSLGSQYYHKIRDYDYDNKLGPPPDEYPGFIQHQQFDIDDVNFRVRFRPLNSLTMVTRYDFQLSRNLMTGDSLPEVQSAETTTHIISESISWSPISRLILQGNFNFVLDSTDTPGDRLGGVMFDQIQKAENNYWGVSALIGYALNEKTDLQFQYFYYRADDYQDNSLYGQPYGAGAEQNGVTATLLRQLTPSLRWTLKYGFFSNFDRTYGGHQDYNAHLVYSSLQYRF